MNDHSDDPVLHIRRICLAVKDLHSRSFNLWTAGGCADKAAALWAIQSLELARDQLSAAIEALKRREGTAEKIVAAMALTYMERRA